MTLLAAASTKPNEVFGLPARHQLTAGAAPCRFEQYQQAGVFTLPTPSVVPQFGKRLLPPEASQLYPHIFLEVFLMLALPFARSNFSFRSGFWTI